MVDRRLTVAKGEDGTTTLRGVAYEADRPNINGTVYPKAVLEKALAEYLEKPEAERLLTVGCAARPKLEDTIGVVTDGEIEDGVVRVEARLFPDRAIGAIAAAYPEDMAFAGAGIAETGDEDEIVAFEVTGMGVVRRDEVES